MSAVHNRVQTVVLVWMQSTVSSAPARLDSLDCVAKPTSTSVFLHPAEMEVLATILLTDGLVYVRKAFRVLLAAQKSPSAHLHHAEMAAPAWKHSMATAAFVLLDIAVWCARRKSANVHPRRADREAHVPMESTDLCALVPPVFLVRSAKPT